MPLTLTDAEIERLILEPKALPRDYRRQLTTKPKRGHKEAQLEVKGDDKSEFRVILRQSSVNLLDFSIILGYRVPKSTQVFRLRRHNGKSHEHTNKIENNTFYDFHIHMATERYQLAGFLEDAYAIMTDRYADFAGALECFINDCGFMMPPSDQLPLFEGGA